jgi:glycosyl transferase family 25
MCKNIVIILLLVVIIGVLVINNRNTQEPFTTLPFRINKTYVINLEHDKARFNDILKMGTRANIPLERFDAINGKLLAANDPYIKKFFSENNKLKNSQKGCALSHIKIWEQIANNKNEIVMILEDDAIIPENFNKKIDKYIKELPIDWEMILLGGNNLIGKRYSKHFIEANPTVKKHCNYGLFGYMIKRSTARKLLDTCVYMSKTIDVQLNKHFYNTNKVYFCYPQLITHNYDYYSNIFNRIRTNDTDKNNKIIIND